jgi:large subunit ribosomal protein L24
VLVEGVNIKKKHQRPRRNARQGQIVEKAMPIHISNVMLVDPKEGKPTRVGKRFDEKKKKYARIAKRSSTTLS